MVSINQNENERAAVLITGCGISDCCSIFGLRPSVDILKPAPFLAMYDDW